MLITIDVPARRIAELISSAIEGGDPVTTASKGGWCDGIYYRTKDTEPPEPDPEREVWYQRREFYDSPDFQLEIIELDDESTGHTTSHIIHRDEVIAGLMVMAEKFAFAFSRVMQGEIDAPCADIFLQCVVFREEKYA